jgi:hypothetical protein
VFQEQEYFTTDTFKRILKEIKLHWRSFR